MYFINNKTLWLWIMGANCLLINPLLAMENNIPPLQAQKRASEDNYQPTKRNKPTPICFDELTSDYNTQTVAPSAPIKEFITIGTEHQTPIRLTVVDIFATPEGAPKKEIPQLPFSYTQATQDWFSPGKAAALYADHKQRGYKLPSPKSTIRAHQIPFHVDKQLHIVKRIITDCGTVQKDSAIRLEYSAAMTIEPTDFKAIETQGKLEYVVNTTQKIIFHRLFKAPRDAQKTYHCRACKTPFGSESDCDEHIQENHKKKIDLTKKMATLQAKLVMKTFPPILDLDGTPIENEANPFCDTCECRFTSPKAFDKHKPACDASTKILARWQTEKTTSPLSDTDTSDYELEDGEIK